MLTLPVPYVDVDCKEELPTAPAGHRYLDFLGGTKHLRCYLVPDDVPRIEFMESFTGFDECLAPVYRHGGVTVRQDASYALPGFYVVAFDRHVRALDQVEPADSAVAAIVTREVRRGMREALGIEHIHLYYEEKAASSTHVHYWLVPVPSRVGDKSTVITRIDIKPYLKQFRFQEQRDTILRYNTRLDEHLTRAGTATRADRIAVAVRAAGGTS